MNFSYFVLVLSFMVQAVVSLPNGKPAFEARDMTYKREELDGNPNEWLSPAPSS
ncbi:hypothetical protein D9613_001179 [Agrocybe pediades]|uniref:Uncharacterized protein n=1 Tax=Agrocybe pediades TaxID=84607 RepID=A0A8H4R0T4_9AGAR|nr:hypothetical protein D9613_001179 [Agrocybe pediades]